jgi:UDP-N-acetyl-D-mannosaminuronate dehydrogenase
MERLARKGTAISYHDPYVGWSHWRAAGSCRSPLDAGTVGRHYLVAILTPHPGIDYLSLVRTAQLVFDVRGVTVGNNAPNIDRL